MADHFKRLALGRYHGYLNTRSTCCEGSAARKPPGFVGAKRLGNKRARAALKVETAAEDPFGGFPATEARVPVAWTSRGLHYRSST